MLYLWFYRPHINTLLEAFCLGIWVGFVKVVSHGVCVCVCVYPLSASLVRFVSATKIEGVVKNCFMIVTL